MRDSCERCGGPFTAKHQRRFCGRDCANKTRAEGVTIWEIFPCERCGAEVKVKPAEARKRSARMCAPCIAARRGVAATAHRPRNMVPCEICEAPIYRPPSESFRRFCSNACSAKARTGKPSARKIGETASLGKSGFRPDIGHFVRSRWEANYARYLKATGSTYEYEPHRFTIRLADGSDHCYTPDFLVDGSHYVEVKGWMRADRRQADVIEAARTQLPLPLMLVHTLEYRQIERDRAAEIPTWEYSGDPTPELPKRICPICGKQVKSIFLKTTYCSRACFGASTRKPKETKACTICGATFDVAPWQATKMFCSRACKVTSQRGVVPAHTPRGGTMPEAQRRKISTTKTGQGHNPHSEATKSKIRESNRKTWEARMATDEGREQHGAKIRAGLSHRSP